LDQTVADSLSVVRDLGMPAEMWAIAERGRRPARRPKVNTHVHLPPNFSPFESVAQTVETAAQQQLGVLGASNYYDFDVYRAFAAETRRCGIFPLFGLEIIVNVDELAGENVLVNDPGVPGKMYICGKGITHFEPMDAAATELIDMIRRSDAERIARLVALTTDIFESHGITAELTYEGIADMVAARHGCPRPTVYLQERHVARSFQEALFDILPGVEERARRLESILDSVFDADPDDAAAVQNALRSHLMKAGKPGFVESSTVSFEQGHRLILALGGIPCYPVLADGMTPISPFEESVDALVEEIQSRNVHAVEFIPVRNEPDVLNRYVRTLRAAGLPVTAGTEHNTLDMISMAPACAGDQPIPDGLDEVFWEGACVVAAHQFLTMHDKCGYVDAEGDPNPGYNSSEGRIAAFAALGAALIRRYFEMSCGPNA